MRDIRADDIDAVLPPPMPLATQLDQAADRLARRTSRLTPLDGDEPGPPIWRCEHCPLTFSYKTMLILHELSFHTDEEPTDWAVSMLTAVATEHRGRASLMLTVDGVDQATFNRLDEREYRVMGRRTKLAKLVRGRESVAIRYMLDDDEAVTS